MSSISVLSRILNICFTGAGSALLLAGLLVSCPQLPACAQIESTIEEEQERLEELKREYWHALRREHSAKEEEIKRMQQEAEESERIFRQSMDRQWHSAAYRVHIGEFDALPCPDGTRLDGEVLKHEIKKPGWNVREEHIVTRHKVVSNGKARYVLGDTFIRFTIQQRNKMHVQIVKRNFDDQGKLEMQVDMSGNLEREKTQ